MTTSNRSMDDLKTLPHDLYAEEAVIGSLIIDPDAIGLIADHLAASDFYRSAHQVIYTAMLQANARGEPADFILLCSMLESDNRLDQIGGASYVTSLITNVPTSANVEHYANVVLKLSLLRRLIGYAARVAASAYESSHAEAEQVLALAHSLLASIDIPTTAGTAQAHPVGLGEYMEKLSVLYENRRNGVQVTGLSTGLPTLDTVTGGLQRGDLVVVAARPSVGKSSLALNMAHSAIRGGATGLFFSLEMSREQLWQRLLSEATGIDQARLRTGNIDDRSFQLGTLTYDGEWALITEQVDELSSTPGVLYVDDTVGITPARMRMRAERLHAQLADRPLDFIFVDYLQLMKSDSSAAGTSRGYENRVQEVSAITKELKALARLMNVPVVALAQLSRAAEGVEPQLSHLKESGAIEEDADIVVFLWLEEAAREIRNHPSSAGPMPSYPVEMRVAKHRKGSVGYIPLMFDPWITCFRERPENEGELA